MKKKIDREIETQEEKEKRWAKARKNAASLARQCGIKINKKPAPKQTEVFDY
jgi:hypothetical protein